MWDHGRTPTLSTNTQNCECGGVPVMDRVELPYIVFKCGLCSTEYRAPAPRRYFESSNT